MNKAKKTKFAVGSTDQSGLPDAGLAEKQIWQRFLNGDVAAFELIMTDYFRILFRYGTRFSKDKEFIKDCIQDLFLYLWEHRSSLRADVALKPYLMVSLRRHMHRNGPNAAFSDEFTDDKVIGFDFMFSVEEQYIHQETMANRIQRTKQLLEKLPRRQKEVLYLKFFQELDRDQIAGIMDIAPQTVSNLMQLALKQLRQHGSVKLLTIWLVHWGLIPALTQLAG